MNTFTKKILLSLLTVGLLLTFCHRRLTVYFVTDNNSLAEHFPSINSKSHKLFSENWQEIIPFIYIYSTFPTLANDAVHVIAVTNREDQPSQSEGTCDCIYKLPENATKIFSAEREDFWDHHGKPYTASRFLCPLPGKFDFHPQYELKMDFQCISNGKIGKKIFVINPVPEAVRMTFALCGPIIFGNYSDVRSLERFLQYYASIGMTKIFIYVNSVSDNVAKLLSHYERKDLVAVLKWNLTLEDYRLHYHGQIAAINDCYLRAAAYGLDYVLIADLDEYIVLSKNTTIVGVVDNGHWDCVNIRSSFARIVNVTSNEVRSANNRKCINDTKNSEIQRQNHIFEPNDRSKYICRVSTVTMAGIHYPYKIRPETKTLTAVPAGEALLLHFRAVDPSFGINSTWQNMEKEFNLDNIHEIFFCL